jgi:endonuclease III
VKKKASPRAPRKPKPARRRGPQLATPGEAAAVLRTLEARWPDAECALQHRNAYELIVATILSAQCTDARVNLVTPAFFERWPTAEALAQASQEDVEAVVRSTGFFRNKAKNLRGMAVRLVAEYGGQVPQAMEDLLTLPGVARKTANVVRGVIWGLADGVVVDTHVARISARLGWTRETTPEKIERDLMALHPREAWIRLAHVLIHHGRGLCLARKPRCEACPVSGRCPSSLAPPPT